MGKSKDREYAWEYQTLYIDRAERYILAEAGKNGWEAYAVDPMHDGTSTICYYMKRKVENPYVQ